MTDILPSERILNELYKKAYGPRFCDNCNKICEVTPYVLHKSEKIRRENNKVILDFMGSIVCKECLKIIEVNND